MLVYTITIHGRKMQMVQLDQVITRPFFVSLL